MLGYRSFSRLGWVGFVAAVCAPLSGGQTSGFGGQQVITTAADEALSAYATDLDGDGDADVLSASNADDKIAWYENLIGDCAPTTYCQASDNSTGLPAGIGHTGSASLAASDLALTVEDAVPNQFGLFFYGAQQTFTPYGDGALCIAPAHYRLWPAVLSNQSGSVSLPLDFGSPPLSSGPGQVTPFSTWNFQYWYRDPFTQVGSGFNFSNGLSVTFCP